MKNRKGKRKLIVCLSGPHSELKKMRWSRITLRLLKGTSIERSWSDGLCSAEL